MTPNASSNAVPTLRWLYLACVVLGSIGAHLFSEFFAMGSDAANVALSPRHIYLGIAALAALVVVIREIGSLRTRASSGRDHKRLAEMALASLPFAGKRYFWAVTAALQFAIGGLTEIGEGCPLCGHDLAAGVAGALFGAIILSLIARALGKRLPSIAAALVEFASIEDHRVASRIFKPQFPQVVTSEFLWYARLFGRPPPRLQFSPIR